MIRPKLAGTCGTAPADTVEVQIVVDRYSELDQTNQVFEFDGYLRAWWNDPRLAYNASECTAPRLLLSPEQVQSMVWTPDFYWEDAAKGKITLPDPWQGSGAASTFAISPNGDVWWSRQASLSLACPMDLRMLPFDRQRCDLTMGMYTHSADEVSLSWRAGQDAVQDGTHVIGGGPSGWHRPTHRWNNTYLQYGDIRYSYAQTTFTFRRQPELYMWSYFFPSLVAVIMASLGFFVKNDALPARVSLGIVSMLISLTNLIALNTSLPAGGGAHTEFDQLPWLLNFMIGSFVWTGLALTILVLASFGQEANVWLEKQRKRMSEAEDRTWQQTLLLQPERFIALLEEWDEDHSKSITKKEFRQGIAALGLKAHAAEVNSLFDAFDRDNDGSITFDELKGYFATASALNAAGATEKEALKKAVPPASPQQSQPPEQQPATGEAELLVEVAEEEGAKQGSSEPSPTVSPRSRATFSGEVSGGLSKARQSVQDLTRTAATTAQTTAQSTASSAREVTKRAGVTLARNLEVDGSVLPSMFRPPSDLRRQTSEMKLKLRREARDLLGKDFIWSIRTFKLGPLLARMRYIDVPARLIFPVGYGIYVLVMLSQVYYLAEED